MKSYNSIRNAAPILDRTPEPALPARDAFSSMQSTDRAPREEIQHRAYAIWQSQGEPNDCALAHWIQAENDVMHRT